MNSYFKFLGIVLTHFWPIFLFYTSWKLKVFWCFHGVLNGNIGQKWVKVIDCLLCLEYLLTSKDFGKLDNCILTFKYSTGAYFGKMVINVMTVSEQWEKGLVFFIFSGCLWVNLKWSDVFLKNYCLESMRPAVQLVYSLFADDFSDDFSGNLERFPGNHVFDSLFNPFVSSVPIVYPPENTRKPKAF